MKKYLRDMFHLDENQWKREFEMEDKNAPYQTFVLQILNNSRVSYANVNAGYKVNSPVSIPFSFLLSYFVIAKFFFTMLDMLITLIIKKDNRKKHNSHEWFLGESGFVNYYRPKYLFLLFFFPLFLVNYFLTKERYAFCTDCSTLFHKACLMQLIQYIIHMYFPKNNNLSLMINKYGKTSEMWCIYRKTESDDERNARRPR